MTTGQLIAWIILPLAIFLLTSAGTGILMLVKVTVYLTKSREAQESTAKTNQQISNDLSKFVGQVNSRFDEQDKRINDHGERIVVLEDFKKRTER